MAIRKKDTLSAALAKEAAAAGLEIVTEGDGTYSVTVPGTEDDDGNALELVDESPRALLDDALAVLAMEADPETYSYDFDEDDRPLVEVQGIDEPFTADSLAEAFKQAAAYAGKRVAQPERKQRRGRAKAAVAEEPAPEPVEAAPAPEPEVLPPASPNGASDSRRVADSDVCRVLIVGLREIAQAASNLADALGKEGDLLPFIGGKFAEDDEVPAGRGRIRRERGK